MPDYDIAAFISGFATGITIALTFLTIQSLVRLRRRRRSERVAQQWRRILAAQNEPRFTMYLKGNDK